MEVALSLSWLRLFFFFAWSHLCTHLSKQTRNKIRKQKKIITGIPGQGSEQCSQALRVTDVAPRPPVTMYRVHHTSPSLLSTLLAPTGWLQWKEALLLPGTCTAASMEGNSTQSGMSGRGVEREGVGEGGSLQLGRKMNSTGLGAHCCWATCKPEKTM